MLELCYTFAKKPTPESIKVCREGLKAYQNALVGVARIGNPLFVPLMWFFSRFYREKITETSIKFSFIFL